MVPAAEHLAGIRQQRRVVAVMDRVEGAGLAGAQGADQVVIRSFGHAPDRRRHDGAGATPPRCAMFTPCMQDPLAPPHRDAGELRARIDAERAGRPFLVLRDGDGTQRIVALGEAGPTRRRSGATPSNDVSLAWDEEVSRLHAELERIGGEWTISDDGLSRNGTFVNGARIAGRRACATAT